jgi:hypothetical protein
LHDFAQRSFLSEQHRLIHLALILTGGKRLFVFWRKPRGWVWVLQVALFLQIALPDRKG